MDVAQYAGVSASTVSHVLNRTAKISQETSERVKQAIITLGYEPRALTELNCGRRTVGVFIPDISNEFYAYAVQEIFSEAWRHDYAVMVCSTQHHHMAEISYIRSLIQGGINGLVFFGGATENEQQILHASKRVPVVLCDRWSPSLPVDSVGTDNIDIMRQVITKLSKCGYTKIGYISEDLIMSNIYDRYQGYRLGMEDNKLTIDKDWVLMAAELRLHKSESAYKIMLDILKKKPALPQVLLCSSDLIAMGIMAALKYNGYNIPRDIGIVGFDNISLAAFTNPPLTGLPPEARSTFKVRGSKIK